MSTARAGGGAVEVTGDCGAAGAVVGGEEVCSTAGAPGAAAGEGEVCASTGGAADGDGEACCTAARLTNLNRGLAPPPPIGATLPHPRNKPGPALVKFGRTTPPPPLETTATCGQASQMIMHPPFFLTHIYFIQRLLKFP